MLRCFCKKKTLPTHEAMLDRIRGVFETDCIRIICMLEKDGRVLSLYAREDVSPMESDTLLQKIAGIKNITIKISAMQNDKCGSMHIQGKSSCCSFYDLPDDTLLVIVADTNPLTSAEMHISETRALVHAKIAELFAKT
jgi:hypothetical protein